MYLIFFKKKKNNFLISQLILFYFFSFKFFVFIQIFIEFLFKQKHLILI